MVKSKSRSRKSRSRTRSRSKAVQRLIDADKKSRARVKATSFRNVPKRKSSTKRKGKRSRSRSRSRSRTKRKPSISLKTQRAQGRAIRKRQGKVVVPCPKKKNNSICTNRGPNSDACAKAKICLDAHSKRQAAAPTGTSVSWPKSVTIRTMPMGSVKRPYACSADDDKDSKLCTFLRKQLYLSKAKPGDHRIFL